jgi:hypothetical protein
MLCCIGVDRRSTTYEPPSPVTRHTMTLARQLARSNFDSFIVYIQPHIAFHISLRSPTNTPTYLSTLQAKSPCTMYCSHASQHSPTLRELPCTVLHNWYVHDRGVADVPPVAIAIIINHFHLCFALLALNASHIADCRHHCSACSDEHVVHLLQH